MELLVVVTRANPDQSTQCRRKISGLAITDSQRLQNPRRQRSGGVHKTQEKLGTELSVSEPGIQEYLPQAGALEKLLLPEELATLLRIETGTLEAWRCRGTGPPCVKLGRKEVRYRPSDVLRWLEERTCQSTWDSEAPLVSRGRAGSR
ncbi:MAG TPA: helix-turn-helix domain-containing protein [Thermoanaerobaculia bacterium]